MLLHHPNPFSATSLTVDASDCAVGAELSQRDKDSSWQPLAFFSHALSPTERKYSTFDRSFWPFISRCDTSVIIWRASPSSFLRTISPWRWPSSPLQTTGHQDRRGICLACRNFPRISATSVEKETWWRTHCLGRHSVLFLRSLSRKFHLLTSELCPLLRTRGLSSMTPAFPA